MTFSALLINFSRLLRLDIKIAAALHLILIHIPAYDR